MEGQILAEFSNVNSTNPKACPTYGGKSSARGGQAHRSDRAGMTANERLLHGDSNYTGKSEGRANENFFEDQPEGTQFAVSHLLPSDAKTEERERLLRRLEMCAKAREESTKIMSIRYAERETVKNKSKQDRQHHLEKLESTRGERDERWVRKLQRSPFAVDLVAENQRIDEENRVRDHVEQRRQRLMAQRNREAHNAVFKRATAETDELDMLRAEKRMLLENERQLKALRDVEKSNARTAQILHERRKTELQKQQAQLAQVVGAPA